MTCVAILAVDFAVFPRSFGKTEKFGTSVMDIGVGTFIVSSALTSKFARSEQFKVTGLKLSSQHLVVLVLGFGRFVVLKAINYHEHVSEYGLHWNFFVTLYCVWTTADLVHAWVSRRLIPYLACAVLMSYQYALVNANLTEFLFSDYRIDLVSANKEGIFSLCGYIPLYLLTEAASHTLFFQANEDTMNLIARPNANNVGSGTGDVSPGSLNRKNTKKKTKPDASTADTAVAAAGTRSIDRLDLPFMQRLGLFAALTWLTWLVSCTIQPTSRRLANLPYVAVVLALSFTIILLLYSADSLSFDKASAVHTLDYMNKHSLLIFLGANVCTGMVNMSIQTIYASNLSAYVVLFSYTIAVTCFAWFVEYITEKVKTRPKPAKI